MFRRAGVQGANDDDDVVDISERLAPYGGGTELSPDWQERFVAADTPRARHLRGEEPLTPLHLVR